LGNEQANEEDRSDIELEIEISDGALVRTKCSYETDTPKHFLDCSRHISFRIFLFCSSQTHHFTSRVCKRGNNQDSAEPIPSIMRRSRFVPIQGTNSLSVKTESNVAEDAKYSIVDVRSAFLHITFALT
jgi:hypothetical protein